MNTARWIISSALLMIGCLSKGLTGIGPDGPSLSDPESRWAGPEVTTLHTSMVIPDGDPNGLILGPMSGGKSGEVLRNVDLMVDLNHPNTVDVALRLRYDQENDGHADAEAEVEIFRARGGSWSGAEANGCPVSLDGPYYFHASESRDDPLDVFRGLKAGGRFYLMVADTLSEDVGTVREWLVRVECARGVESL